MYINISKEINKNAVSMESGSVLYTIIFNEMQQNDKKIVIDFGDLNLIASPFFNASISYLLKDYSIQDVLKRLELVNLPDYARKILNVSIQNALEHYNKV